jgi:N-methylhydantoinase A
VQEGSFQKASIVSRNDMKAGDWVSGPAVITERETSTIITASREVIMQADGCLLVRVKQSA